MVPLIENGKYLCTVASHALAKSRDKGTPSVKLCLTTKHPVGDPANRIVETVYYDGWLTDSCFDRTMEMLRNVFGWTGFDINELNENQRLLSGILCVAVVENERYDGKTYPKVKFVNPVSGGIPALENQEAVEMSNALKGRIAAFRAKTKGTPAPEPVRNIDEAATVQDVPGVDSGEPPTPNTVPSASPNDDLPF